MSYRIDNYKNKFRLNILEQMFSNDSHSGSVAYLPFVLQIFAQLRPP